MDFKYLVIGGLLGAVAQAVAIYIVLRGALL